MTTNREKLRQGASPPGTEVVPRNAYESIKVAFDKNEEAFARALTGHAMGVDGFKQAVLNMAIASPAILDCDPKSIIGAALICASTGLHPGPEGYAHIVPYNENVGDYRNPVWVKKAQFQYGFKGLLKLAYETGRITDVLVEAVYGGDEFHYQLGTDPRIDHVPDPTVPHDEAHLTHVYCVLFMRDAPRPSFRVMTKDEIDLVRRGSKGAFDKQGSPKKSSPWFTHYVEMARKTVLRNHMKTTYLGDKFARYFDQDEKSVTWTPKVAELTSGDVLAAPDQTNWEVDEAEAEEPASEPEPAVCEDDTEDAAPEAEDAEIVADEVDPIVALREAAEAKLGAMAEDEPEPTPKAKPRKKKEAAPEPTSGPDEAAPAAPAVPPGEAITEQMMRGLNMTLKNMDVPDETLREWLSELGKTSRKELTKVEAIALIKRAGAYRR